MPRSDARGFLYSDPPTADAEGEDEEAEPPSIETEPGSAAASDPVRSAPADD